MSNAQYGSRRLSEDGGRHELGGGLVLETPAGFQAQIAPQTWSEATRRDVSGEVVQPPPGLAPHRFFPPVGPADRAGEGYALDFAVEERHRQMVTENTPLRLQLPPEAVSDATDVLVVAFDGQDYLPVGYPQDDQWRELRDTPAVLEVPGLPSQHGQEDEFRLDFRHALRLFIYKKLGLRNPPYLRYVEAIGEEVQYGEVQKGQFKAGDKVALFIHGFASDTEGVIKQSAHIGSDHKVRLFRRADPHFAGLPYDHLLAFDYEGFGTPIDENGATFGNELRTKCGFGEGDGVTVHVYAHSMGCLVTRCMVELPERKGQKLVDRVVLAGAPNEGTPLIAAKRGLEFLLAVLITLPTGIPPLGRAACWLARQILKEGKGPEQGAPDSTLIQRLNAATTPSQVPYLVLAGKHTLEDPSGGTIGRLARKIMQEGLFDFYGGANDCAVSVSSMEGVGDTEYPLATVPPVGLPHLRCHHFGYFKYESQPPDGPTAIRDWLP